MPFTDVIDNYSNGASGTLTDSSGDTVGYTVSSTSPTVNWNALDGGARVNANGTQAFTVTFDQLVTGAAMQISGSDSNELYFIEVDGVAVNLASLIASGDVTLTQSGAATHTANADGSISGGHYTDGSIAELVFNFPVTSLGAYGTNGGSGNWDYFEVGIDDTISNVVCFADGTFITLENGPHLIETLTVGDRVTTFGSTSKPIRWIGSRTFGKTMLARNPQLRPVRITAGALGNGLPTRDLLVSRQHRLLVSSKAVARMFDVTDVLVAAIKLTDLPGIFVDASVEEVTYFHLLFDDHEVIFAEGAPAESFYAGYEALKTVPKDSQQEILTIFPELAHKRSDASPALLIPNNKLQKRLVDRHLRNQMPVLQSFQHA